MTLATSDRPIVTEENLDFLSKKYHLPSCRDLSDSRFVQKRKRLIPYAVAKSSMLFPFDEEGEKVKVALCQPHDIEAIEYLAHLLQRPLIEVLVPQSSIEAAIEMCYRQSQEEADEYIGALRSESSDLKVLDDESEYDLLASSADSQVIQLLNMILIQAIEMGASDIHFEPSEVGMRVRYRIDGVMQLKHTPPAHLQHELTTRIKVISKLDIAEHRLPQDGRIKLKMGGREIDFRVSTIPVIYGERVVLRILDRSNITLGLDQISMPEKTLKTFRKQIAQSQGIVLVTGPTGSGKTTTLYSALMELQSEETNIMTIEDPVEYKFPSMAQIGVNPKISLNFAKGLRHILRQDPDIVMVGEIRDRETAEIAIQASLTGHLVLSTLHTNDAPSALTRLIDMEVEPYLLASSLIGILAQRLVRKICDKCKTAYPPLMEEVEELQLKLTPEQFYRGTGCEACFQTGYKGRHGIYELMPVSSEIKKHLNGSVNSSLIGKIARQEGMKTLRQAGALLAVQGVTTTSEVLRVTRAIDESEID